jgi:hypothetical protein
MAKKVDGEKVFKDMLALLGNPEPHLFVGGCRLLLESEIWLMQQDAQHLTDIYTCLRERFKTSTDDEKPYALMALDRVAKLQGLGVR